ncbi:hypothetical protein QUA20_15925, partial [Microcoleus sp. Pol7_A1]|uniref:hypothetical protein n=1 Tax=Microcoleus sp. Pol7_A1 TaxID=2818893 RepID=UPI002FD796D3
NYNGHGDNDNYNGHGDNDNYNGHGDNDNYNGHGDGHFDHPGAAATSDSSHASPRATFCRWLSCRK